MLLSLLVAIGCDGVSRPPVATNPEAGKVRLEITSSGCGGKVWWGVGSANNTSNGEKVSFPWSQSVSGRSGDYVFLSTCSSCDVQCGSPPCFVTLTTTIRWEGTVVATDHVGGTKGVDCSPESAVQATIP